MQSAWGEDVAEGRYAGHPGLVYPRRPRSFAELFTGAQRWVDRTFLVQGERRIGFGEFFAADDALTFDEKAFEKRLKKDPAAVELLRRLGAEVVAACFVIDLPEIGGADKLRAAGVEVVEYPELGGVVREINAGVLAGA